jgi:putative copper resistance protein D
MDNFLYIPRSLTSSLFDLAFATTFGSLFALIWLPSSTPARRLNLTLRLAPLTLLLTLPVQLWLLTATMLGSAAPSDIRPALHDVLTATHAGRILFPDFVCALLLFFASFSRRRAAVRAALAVAFLLAAFRAASGHAAANGDFTLAELVQFLHLASIAVWSGTILIAGFLVLHRLTALEEKTRFGRRLSRTATVAIFFVAFSGIYNSWLGLGSPHHVTGALQPLPHTQWGILLLVKSTLVLVALALGAHNRFILARNPTLLAPDARRFTLSMRIEACAMLAILAISGFLANSPPAAGM